MIKWCGGVLFGFLLFMAFYRNRPKLSKIISWTNIKLRSISSKIYDIPGRFALYIKKLIKLVIFTFWPTIGRNLTKCKDRQFIILIFKPSNDPHFEYSVNFSKLKNDENKGSGKRGKMFFVTNTKIILVSPWSSSPEIVSFPALEEDINYGATIFLTLISLRRFLRCT